MTIAIQKTRNSFFEEWVSYCDMKQINYEVVDFKKPDFLTRVQECDALMWHHQHSLPHDLLVAKGILNAASAAGLAVFPSFNDGWHFDDKLAQRYLLGLHNIETPKTWVFYSANELWNNKADLTFPLVFKIRSGAGSRNVKLITDEQALRRLSTSVFGSGLRQYDAIGGIKESLRKKRIGKSSWKDVVKAVAHTVYPLTIERVSGKAWGYAYLQEYIKSDCDYRVIVVGDKAFAIRRLVRDNDFRASGSGFIEYDKRLFRDHLIAHSFSIAQKLNCESIAFDFVMRDNRPVLLEISYGWNKAGYLKCPGYWDKNLNWHEGSFNPYGWMVDLVCDKINKTQHA